MYASEVKPRDDFDEFLEEEAGYHRDRQGYVESRYVAQITEHQADFLAGVAEEVYQMCLAAVEKVVTEGRYKEFGIGPQQARHIKASWHRQQALPDGSTRDPELYGRFDFFWDGKNNAKFYEINADTPTSSYECSVLQWAVVNDLKERGELDPDLSQFNYLEDKIVERWAHILKMSAGRSINKLYFSAVTDWKEDVTTTSYLEALAQKAGWDTKFIDVRLIGANEDALSPAYGKFYDTDDEEIKALYKLMPWEHIYESEYAKYAARDEILFFEPPWKAILSNKMLSVILWEMYPDHPCLLPAYKTPEKFNGTYVEKPIFGRIGAGIKAVQNNVITGCKKTNLDEPPSVYERYPKVYQQFCPLPEMPGLPGWRYQTGVWVVGNGEAAGMDLRVDRNLVMGNDTQRFLSHVMTAK